MKIAIHHRKDSFSEHWITYCKENDIDYKVVNAYDSDIIQQIEDCDAFMWHHHHTNYKDVLFAKQLLFSIQQSGKKVFPDFNTGWHFDDKVGQKYLLEAIGVSLVPSYVFYDKETAFNWVGKTSFPKVFKLRGGAGAANVKLVHSSKGAKKLIKKVFSKGFSGFDRFNYLKETYRKYRLGKSSAKGVIIAVKLLFTSTEFAKMHAREKGYVYFQDFIPDNKFDIRVIVIEDKAFAIKRMVRDDDFRASGSGNIIYDKNEINESCVKLAFDVNAKLKGQVVAYDFVFDKNQLPLIVEISYAYTANGYEPCPGYWNSELNWFPGKFNPQHWMIENLIKNA